MKIVANRCRDVLRSAYRRRTLSLEALTLDVDPSFTASTESPEDYTMRRELGREIQNGLETIPQDQRMVLVLVDIQGLGYEEAAEVTGASLGTVKSRLSRGRARLRDYLRTKEELLPGRFRQKG